MVDPHADEDYFSQLQAAVGRCTTLRQLDLLVKSCDTEIAHMSSKALWKLHQTWYTEMQLPTMSEVYFFHLDLLLVLLIFTLNKAHHVFGTRHYYVVENCAFNGLDLCYMCCVFNLERKYIKQVLLQVLIQIKTTYFFTS